MRGATEKFYEWLQSETRAALPEGPSVWICGDCHLGNLGPVADLRGDVSIQVRDLDQTVIGNPAHDLVRLALSLATAARGSDLPGVTTARILEHLVEAYTEARLARQRSIGRCPNRSRGSSNGLFAAGGGTWPKTGITMHAP